MTIETLEIAVETLGALVMIGASIAILALRPRRFAGKGGRLVIAGALLVAFGACVDGLDEFDAMDELLSIRGVFAQLVLEKIVGYGAGFACLYIGLVRFIRRHEAHDEHSEQTLDSHRRRTAELEARVRERTAELERSNADLQQFAYAASHDLQAPLRTVASYLGLLERKVGPTLDAEGREYMDFALDGARRMNRLIKDLLDYARVDTRRAAPAPVDLGAALAGVQGDLRQVIAEAGATVTADALPTVVGDGAQLGRLLQNLVGNALKYRSPDRPPQVHVGAARDGGFWVVSVRDNGIGIDPDHFDRIFLIFQRLHGPRAYEGTGIGLAICKRIVENHGGRIWVDSTPGEGSTFHFTLPVAMAPAAEKSAITEAV